MSKVQELNLNDISLSDTLGAADSHDLDFVNCQVITGQRQLDYFLSNLRQDKYSREQLQEMGVISESKDWLNGQEEGFPGESVLFAVEEPDDHARNDGWGLTYLYKAIAFRHRDELHIHLAEEVKVFM